MSITDPNDTTVLVCTGLGLATVLAGLFYVTNVESAASVTAVNAQAGLMSADRDELATRGSVAFEGSDADTQIAQTFIAGNESAAIDALLAIVDAQERAREAGALDADGDGHGEYAFLGELMGLAVRELPLLEGEEQAPVLHVDPATLPADFGTLTQSSRGTVLLRDGYAFQVHLPGPSGEGENIDIYPGLTESGAAGVGGSAPQAVQPDPVASAHVWACYAWPLEHGRTGERAFFVNQEGVVVETANGSGVYVGLERVPRFDAALSASGRGNLLAAPGWADGPTGDGLQWSAVAR